MKRLKFLPATLALIIMSFVANLLLLAGPIFMLQVYERVLASQSVQTLVALTVLITALYGVYWIIELLRARMGARFARIIETNLSEKVYAGVLKLHSRPTKDQGNPFVDLETVRRVLGGTGPTSLIDLPWVPVYIGVIYLFHAYLGWVAITGAVVLVLILVINQLVAKGGMEKLGTEISQRQTMMQNAKANAEPAVAMGMTKDVASRWQEQSVPYDELQLKISDTTAFFANLTKTFRRLLQSLILAVGAYLVIEGEINAGVMITASIILSQALMPVEQFVANWRSLTSARQSLKRLNQLIKDVHVDKKQLPLPAPKSLLEVTNLVSGPYLDKSPTIRGVDFALQSGDALGILGKERRRQINAHTLHRRRLASHGGHHPI